MKGPGKRISLLVVDDHPLMCEGIACVVNAEDDMEVVAEAGNGREAIERYRQLMPDVTLMDLQMPMMDGVSATAAIRSECSSARILVLSTYQGDVQALRALQAGASGYLLKGTIRTDLLAAIRTVHGGGRYIPADVAVQLAAHVTDDALSVRELDVLKLVADGNSNGRVAARLAVTEETVKSHMKNIMNKLAARDRTHAVMIAIQRGIIDR